MPSVNPDKDYAHAVLTRSFEDVVGVRWTVNEIHSPDLPPVLRQALGAERRAGGWLLFESAEGERRRLNRFPVNWRICTEFELERWCMRAQSVPPGPERRTADRAE